MAILPLNNITGRSNGQNTNVVRFIATANGAALSTGVMTSVSIWLEGGATIKKVGFVSATTAAATPTHWGFAVYSTAATPALLGNTADQLTAAWAANTLMNLSLATPVVVPKAGWYWVSVWMAAATVPTLLSAPAMTAGLLNTSGINVIPSTDKALAVTSGTALVAPPATIATPTTSLVVPLAYIS